jgi:UDP-2-acetamido-2,6-beta-L-arabino-hexul-4-ose reductase
MMAIQIQHIKVHADARGYVFEPLDLENICIQKNVHIVISDPGVVRGNHYHMNGTETVAVMGHALVCIRKNHEIQNIKVPRDAVFRFIIPPKISHAFKNIDNQPNMLVCFNTLEYDTRHPDVIEDILISTLI